MKTVMKAAAVAAVLFCPYAATAQQTVLQPGDPIIAIDFALETFPSSSPPTEGAVNAVDNSTATKYLNFAQENTGIMITPFFGESTAQSMVLTTANDHSTRDPASWIVYGTNDFIDHFAANHGDGNPAGVTWTQIAAGDVALPGTLPGGNQGSPDNNGRLEAGPVLSFANSTPYASYKIKFPTVKDPMGLGADSMQVSEIALYPTLDGPTSGSNIFSILDSDVTRVSAFADEPRVELISNSSSPGSGNENVPNVIDANAGTKYLNFGETGSGFIVSPAAGSSIVTSFQMTTANDAPERDPAGWTLWGTNDPITSADHSDGQAENWVEVATGTVELSMDRGAVGPMVTFANSTAYSSYRMTYTVRDAADANSMQLAEIQFFGTITASPADDADFDNDGDVDGQDFLVWQRGVGLSGQTNNDNGDATGDGLVDGADLTAWSAAFGGSAGAAAGAVPEPATGALALLGLAVAAAARRRR